MRKTGAEAVWKGRGGGHGGGFRSERGKCRRGKGAVVDQRQRVWGGLGERTRTIFDLGGRSETAEGGEGRAVSIRAVAWVGMGKGRCSISSSREGLHREHNRLLRDVNRPSLHTRQRTTKYAESARFEIRN